VAVDVLTEIHIDRPRAEVAAHASDIDHTTEWYENSSRPSSSAAPDPRSWYSSRTRASGYRGSGAVAVK
jgi:hypothetical protein